MLTVCEAGKQLPGARIVVKGEFDGTGKGRASTVVTLASENVCTERGAGGVIAEMINQEEMVKLGNAQPRGKRTRTPGAILTVEGVVTKVEDGRFVTLNRGVFR